MKSLFRKRMNKEVTKASSVFMFPDPRILILGLSLHYQGPKSVEFELWMT